LRADLKKLAILFVFLVIKKKINDFRGDRSPDFLRRIQYAGSDG